MITQPNCPQRSLMIPLFNAAVTNASFPPEMLQATIITLTKPGKPTNALQNFRPISLLKVDVKLYAKLIANRLSNFLPRLVKQDHVGFVVGHQAPDATRRIINLIHMSEKNKRLLIGYIGGPYLRCKINLALLALYTQPFLHFTLGPRHMCFLMVYTRHLLKSLMGPGRGAPCLHCNSFSS